MRYRVLPKTGPGHTVSYPRPDALERLLAARAIGSDEVARVRMELDAAGAIRHAVAGEIVSDLPAMSIAALIAGGDVEAVTLEAAPILDGADGDENGGEA